MTAVLAAQCLTSFGTRKLYVDRLDTEQMRKSAGKHDTISTRALEVSEFVLRERSSTRRIPGSPAVAWTMLPVLCSRTS